MMEKSSVQGTGKTAVGTGKIAGETGETAVGTMGGITKIASSWIPISGILDIKNLQKYVFP
jgi:hypothetical protein